MNKLAIGGGDFHVQIWDIRNTKECQYKCKFHKASVSAIAWSPPHDYNVLCTCGGYRGMKICKWNLNQTLSRSLNFKNAFNGYCVILTRPALYVQTTDQIL